MNGMLTAAIVVTVILVAVIVVLGLKYKDLRTQTDIAKKDLQERESIMQKEALIKAKALQKVTKMPIIADDTGLEIVAMGNKPGLHTARFAKEFGGYLGAFNEIFQQLEGKERTAYFVCDIVLLNVDDLRQESQDISLLKSSEKKVLGMIQSSSMMKLVRLMLLWDKKKKTAYHTAVKL